MDLLVDRQLFNKLSEEKSISDDLPEPGTIILFPLPPKAGVTLPALGDLLPLSDFLFFLTL